jgi:hypothetical protein
VSELYFKSSCIHIPVFAVSFLLQKYLVFCFHFYALGYEAEPIIFYPCRPTQYMELFVGWKYELSVQTVPILIILFTFFVNPSGVMFLVC